jgi:monothiol glutaredoxin
MSLAPELRQRIQALIDSSDVVLFMKGTRMRPECGFSQAVVRILDGLIPEYETINVLEQPDLRAGIKEFSSWPTIPQLYVRGELLGGCDILQEMYASGELHRALGLPPPERATPDVAISDAAARHLRQAIEQSEVPHLHLHIDARGQARIGFAQPGGAEIEVESSGIRLLMSPETAPRAEGIRIDFVETAQGSGLTLRRAQAAAVQPMSVQELSRLMQAGEPFELIDVRTAEERGIAHIEGSQLLDEDLARRIAALDRGTRLIFHCHLGGRSQAAAEHFAELGFRNTHNLTGGIDAWSREIDPSVPTY